MSSLTANRKAERFYATEGTILNDRIYNLTLGGIVLYGLVLNALMCYFIGDKLNDISPIPFIIGYFVCCITGILLSTKSTNPFISFIGYNLVVIPIGIVVSMSVSTYVNEGFGDILLPAIVYTAAATAGMIVLSITFPQFFSKLGGILFGALLGLVIAEIVTMIFFGNAFTNVYAWIGIVIFSLYIGYDYWKAQEYPKTLDNAVDSALDLYLDIINLFLKILQILASSKSSNSSKRK